MKTNETVMIVDLKGSRLILLLCGLSGKRRLFENPDV